MSSRVVWVQRNGPPEFTLGPGPVPIVNQLDVPQRGMSFSERVVDFERLFRRFFRLREAVLWWERAGVECPQQHVAVSQAGVSQRIVRVDRYCLLEVTYSLLVLRFSPLLPEILA